MSELNIDAAMASMTDEPLPNPEAEAPEQSKVSQPRNENGQFVSPDQDEPAEDRESHELRAEEPDEPAEDGESEDPKEQRRPNNRKTWSERLSQVSAQKNEAIARAEAAEARLRELQERYQQPVDPNLEFEDPDAWQRQQFERVLDEREARSLQQQYQQAQQAAFQSSIVSFQERLAESRESMPDFDQVFDERVPVSEAAVEFLGESDVGPQVAYYLGKNRSEAQRIASLPPHRQWGELARIEQRVSARPARKTSAAPPPARAVTGGGSTGQFSAQDASVEDIAKLLGYGKR